MKTLKKTLSLTLVFALVFSLMSMAFAAETTTTSTTTTGYKDAADITYKEAVDVTSAIGVFQGNDSKAFAPKDNLTREQAAKVICYLTMGKAAADKLTTSAAPFTDVPAGRWSAGSIAYCKQQGIIAGYGDGNFGPTDTVTGYQFAKMLLGSLGYDATIEHFNGSDWQINVAKRAFQNKLSEGNDAFVGTAAATREEAALYVLNLLKAGTVSYATKGTEIKLPDGTTVRQGASAPSQDATAYTFMSSNIPGLTLNGRNTALSTTAWSAPQVDDFQRAANKWVLNGKTIGTYAINAAAVSYTAKKTETAVAQDLKGYSFGTTVALNVNGETAGTLATKTAAGVATLTGNGVSVQVYATNNVIDKIVVINSVLAKVAAVNPKTEIVTYTVLPTVAGTYGAAGGSFNSTVGYGKVTKDDYVMVTAYDAASATLASTATVAEVVPAKVVKGTSVAVSTANNSITVAGTAYTGAKNIVSGKAVTDFAVSAKYDATLILDANGYIALAEPGVAATSDNALAVISGYNTLKDGKIVPVIKAITSNGTVVDVPAATDYSTGHDYTIDTYTFSPLTGLYTLKGAPTVWNSDTTYAPDNASNTSRTFTVNETLVGNEKSRSVTYTTGTATYFFADNVKFIFVDNANKQYKVMDGVQKVTSAANITYVLGKIGGTYQIVAAYVPAAAPVSSTTAEGLLYVVGGQTGTVQVADSTAPTGVSNFKTYDAYINGKAVDNFYAAETIATSGFYSVAKNSANGAYVLTGTTYVSAGTVSVAPNMTVTAVANNKYLALTGGLDLDISSAIIVDTDGGSLTSAAAIQLALAEDHTVQISAVYNPLTNVASHVYVTQA